MSLGFVLFTTGLATVEQVHKHNEKHGGGFSLPGWSHQLVVPAAVGLKVTRSVVDHVETVRCFQDRGVSEV